MASAPHDRLAIAAESASAPARARRVELADLPAYVLCLLAGVSIIAVTALLVHSLWVDSHLSRHQFGWQFLIGRNWDPVQEVYGALPYIYGTIVTSVLALAIAVPMGLGAAIFLAELAPSKISVGLTFLI